MRVALAILFGVACAACGRFGFASSSDAGGAGTPSDASGGELGGDASVIVSGPVPPDFVDGTRLRASRSVDASGVGAFVDWYDTALAAHCQFRVAADGVLRCLPYLALTSTYADAGCTQPLGFVQNPQADAACDQPQSYAASQSDTPGHVYQLGAAFAGTIYAGNATTCGVANYSGTPYALAGEVPPTMFVAAHERITAHGRLAAIEWAADDGSSQLTSTFVDSVLGTRCTIAELDEGSAYCLTDDIFSYAAGLAYADAACSEPVVLSNGSATTSKQFTFSPTLCSNNVRIFEIGATTTAPLYAPTATGCAPLALQTYQVAYTTTTELALDTLDTLTLVVDSGSDRLRTTHWRDADGNGAPDLTWDSMRGGRCRPIVDETTNELWCSPRWIDSGMPFYSDDACSMVALGGKPACRDASTGIQFGTTDIDNAFTCDGFRNSFVYYDDPVPTSTTLYTANADGSCTLVDLIATPVIQTASGFLDATTLVQLTNATD